MDRTINLSKLRKTLYESFDEFKNANEGTPDARLEGVDADKFGISLALADGTIINKGDTAVASAIGGLVKIPISSILLEQNGAEDLIKKSNQCPMMPKGEKPAVKGARGIRAVSAIEPVGDPESKWDIIENRMISLMGSAPQLNDKFYEKLKTDIDSEVNALAAAEFFLYDDGAMSVDLYRRATAMTATAEQLAIMGATIAADGVNPLTRKIVFDGRYAKNIVGMMAAHGPRKMRRPWDMLTGLPALSSFGGTVLGIFPGVMAIAAYSPRLMPNNVSLKAAKSIMTLMRKLDISVFQSAKLTIDKER